MATRRMTHAQRRETTRAALLDAAARVFIERGFAGSSVEAISEAAGYTRGAFYAHFRTKEELFAELLQQRVFAVYRAMAADAASTPPVERAGPREVGEQLARIQASPDGRWLFRLWLELLAHAGRSEDFRQIAAGFWSGTRTLMTEGIKALYRAGNAEPPARPSDLASAMIALDIGLALQHFVDPDAVPLSVYPELYELLFGGLAPGSVSGH